MDRPRFYRTFSYGRRRRRRDQHRHRRRGLFPHVTRSDIDLARFRHEDLPCLSDAELWAEQTDLTGWLAGRLRRRDPDVLLDTYLRGHHIWLNDWIVERIDRLRGEQDRRERPGR